MLGMPLDLGVLLFHQEWNEGQNPEIAEYNHYGAIRAGLGRWRCRWWRCRRWWCRRWWCRWRTRGAGGLIVFHFSLSSIDKEAFSTLMGSTFLTQPKATNKHYHPIRWPKLLHVDGPSEIPALQERRRPETGGIPSRPGYWIESKAAAARFRLMVAARLPSLVASARESYNP